MKVSTTDLLPLSYFQQEDVVSLARELLGKELVCQLPEGIISGKIVETEAYAGATDKASHAYGNKRTGRTETMYLPGGHIYVYLCYGIHHLLNIVTHREGTPHAVLIRALEPLEGKQLIRTRRGNKVADHALCAGPGSLCKAMGIDLSWNGLALNGERIGIREGALPGEIIASPRVGVAYAKEDALLPWRFRIRNNPFTSKAK